MAPLGSHPLSRHLFPSRASLPLFHPKALFFPYPSDPARSKRTYPYACFFSCIFLYPSKKETLQMMWKASQKSSYFSDISWGILGWLVSFPIVSLINHLAEKINYLLFNIQATEQVAVRYLRFVAKSPGLLTIALISILLFAPLIEECIFRGFLQTYLKQKLKFKWALLLSSFIFAIFHFSFSQGMQNFPLLLSLFSLSIFLGFLYEKQHSLLSPITLHMTFNLITVIRILLLKD